MTLKSNFIPERNVAYLVPFVIWAILYHMITPPFWERGHSFWKMQTWGHRPVVREACGCVGALGEAHGFPSRFPLWAKAEIHQEDQEVRFMAHKEEEGAWDVGVSRVTPHKWKERSGVWEARSKGRTRSQDYTARGWILVSKFIRCMTSRKLVELSVLYFPHL